LFSFFNPKISEAIPKLHKLFEGGEVKKIPAGSPLALEEKKLLPWLTGFRGNSRTGFLLPVKWQIGGGQNG
jgi:hypothetical protein